MRESRPQRQRDSGSTKAASISPDREPSRLAAGGNGLGGWTIWRPLAHVAAASRDGSRSDPELDVALGVSVRAALRSRKPLVQGRVGSPPPAAECLPSLARFPEWPNPRKAAFCPSAVSLAYITRPGGGCRRPREYQSYPRRGSCVSPATLRDDGAGRILG